MSNIKRTLKEQQFIKSYIDCNGNILKVYLAINEYL